jgi:7,8-dihydropterin-6-yl-methyl-4-(beta-D-ribofuranosyl)aminobenzene 5'-phosphate synthase
MDMKTEPDVRVARWAKIGILGFLTVAGAAAAELEIRIIYDNTSAGLQEDWGYAALVTFRSKNVLFDSGTKPDLFLRNLDALKIDAKSIATALISHEHPDHRNGIYRLYSRNPAMKVHFLDNFQPKAFEEANAVDMLPVRVLGPVEIAPGMYTTGIIEGSPSDQSLLIETSRGLVVMTGCSHPGVVRIVETALKQRGKTAVRTLLGGFHMFQMKQEEIESIVGRLKGLGVQNVIPAHCTGDAARQRFREVFRDSYSEAGAGKFIRLD